jgi:hypothetical protein
MLASKAGFKGKAENSAVFTRTLYNANDGGNAVIELTMVTDPGMPDLIRLVMYFEITQMRLIVIGRESIHLT